MNDEEVCEAFSVFDDDHMSCADHSSFARGVTITDLPNLKLADSAGSTRSTHFVHQRTLNHDKSAFALLG